MVVPNSKKTDSLMDDQSMIPKGCLYDMISGTKIVIAGLWRKEGRKFTNKKKR